jgi:hypothetical protein
MNQNPETPSAVPDVKEEEARKWRLSERYGWLVRLLDFVKGNGDHPPSLWRVEEMLTDYLKTPTEKKAAVAESVDAPEKALEEKEVDVSAGNAPRQKEREQRFARIVAATGVHPDYLVAWCNERELDQQRLADLEYPYWTVKDPSGHLVHTCIATTKEDSVKEWIETEQAVNACANMVRQAKGGESRCAQSWEAFEAEGYSLVSVDVIEPRTTNLVDNSSKLVFPPPSSSSANAKEKCPNCGWPGYDNENLRESAPSLIKEQPAVERENLGLEEA